MNNLVFNTTADQLKTSLYAQAADTSFQPLQIDASGNLMVLIDNVTVTVAGDVTITNATLSIEGDVTVAGDVTITNAMLTIEGDVTVAGDVTITNATITTLVSGSEFTSDAVTSTSVTGTGVIFPDTDISTLKVASILVYNEGAETLTLSLQISPTTTPGDYMPDPDYGAFTVGSNATKFVAISNFAHYVQLGYELGGTTATFSAHYQAQA